MAKKTKEARVQVILECTEQKASGMPGMSRYITTKNRKNTPDRLELKKYNPILKKYTIHKELKYERTELWQRKRLLPCKQVTRDVCTPSASKWLKVPRQAHTSSRRRSWKTKMHWLISSKQTVPEFSELNKKEAV